MPSFGQGGRRKRKKKGTPTFPSKDTAQQMHQPLPCIYSWPELSLVAIIAAMEAGKSSLGPAVKCPANIEDSITEEEGKNEY